MRRFLAVTVCFGLVAMGSLLLADEGGKPDEVPPVEAGPPEGVPPEGMPPPHAGPPEGVPPVDRGKPDDVPHGPMAVNSRHLLLPPVDAEDQDARGDLWLKENPARSAIRVQVRNLEPEVTYDVMIALGEMSELLGMVTTCPEEEPVEEEPLEEEPEEEEGDDDGDCHPGSGHLRLDTRRGDLLPLGVSSVKDLVGAVVTVVAPPAEEEGEGVVVLETTVVDLEVHTPGRKGPKGPPEDDGNGDDGNGDDGNGDDGNGDEEIGEGAAFLVVGRHDATFTRGDVNGDGHVDVSDAIQALGVLFLGADRPYCWDAFDANDDGNADIADPIATLLMLFSGGAILPPPQGVPGFDPTPDALFCDTDGLSGL